MAGNFTKLGAGDYSDRLYQQTPTITTSATSGQKKIVWPDDNNGLGLWCAVQELRGGEKEALGLTVQDQAVRIRIHEHPPITTQDRLIDKKRDCIYTIENIGWALTEWVITARRSQGIR